MAKRSAFTLVELLVVIAIISLLVSILTPTLNRAKELARRAVCAVHLREQMTAMQMYLNENKDYLPGAHTGWGAPEAPVFIWMTRIRRYMSKTEKGFNCPSVESEKYCWVKRYGSGQPARWGYEADEQRIRSNTYFTYGINDWGVSEFTKNHLGLGNHIEQTVSTGWEFGEIRISRIFSPGDLIAIGDSTPDGIWDGVIDPNDKPGYLVEAPGDRHSGGLNIVFCDSHVEYWLQDEALVRPGEDGDLSRASHWNNDGRPHDAEWLPYTPG